MTIFRCSICNRVNNEEIETEYGDYSEFMAFVPDPSNPMFDICMMCAECISDTLFELEEDEDEEAFDYDVET